MHKLVLNIILSLELLRNQAPQHEKAAYTHAIEAVMEVYDMVCFAKSEKKKRKKSQTGANCHGSEN